MKKQANNIAVLLLLVLLSAQCRSQPTASVSGEITLADGWKPVVYLLRPHGFSEIAASFVGEIVDSAAVSADGRFIFPKIMAPDGPGALFELYAQKTGERYPNRLLDDEAATANYAPIVLKKGEKVEFFGKIDQIQASFSLKNPSAENVAMARLRDLRQRMASDFQKILKKTDGQPVEETLLEREDALRRSQRPLMDFADSCGQLLPALVAVRWVGGAAGDFERLPEFLFRQCQKWSAQLPENQLVMQLCQVAGRDRLPVLTGDEIPDSPLPMATGDTVGLRQLLGARLTILDIWASWCAPCRRENRETLKPVWEKYRSSGLQIVGYSIDADGAAWRAAIARDGADWPQASHLVGDAAPFLGNLRIATIPANFILDGQGRVVAKNLHGDAMRAFVEAYFR